LLVLLIAKAMTFPGGGLSIAGVVLGWNGAESRLENAIRAMAQGDFLNIAKQRRLRGIRVGRSWERKP